MQKYPAPKIPKDSRKVATCHSRYSNRQRIVHIPLRSNRTNPRFVHLNESVKLAFRDWKILINMTTNKSINVKQLVARYPEYSKK